MEELREVFSLRKSDDLTLEVLHVSFHVSWNCSGFVVVSLCDVSAGLSVSNFNNIANLQLERWDVDHLSIYHDVAVADHLSSLEDRLCVTQSPNRSCESEFEKSEEVKAGVAAHSLGFLKRVRELLLEHVVVAADDLLREKLLTVLGSSVVVLLVRTVLAKRILSLGCRALWTTPNVKADFAADVCLSSSISCHE